MCIIAKKKSCPGPSRAKSLGRHPRQHFVALDQMVPSDGGEMQQEIPEMKRFGVGGAEESDQEPPAVVSQRGL